MLFLTPEFSESLTLHTTDKLGAHAGIRVRDVSESAYYYEHGLGVARACFRCQWSSAEELASLSRAFDAFGAHLVPINLLDPFANWSDFSLALGNAIGGRRFQDGSSIFDDKINRGANHFEWNSGSLLLHSYSLPSFLEKNIQVDEKGLSIIGSAFCGKTISAEDMLSSAHGLNYSHHGYAGRFAVVKDPEIGEKMVWLWDMSVLHTGALSSLAEALHSQAVDMLRSNWRSSAARRQLEVLERSRLTGSVIEYEGRPEVFAGSALEGHVYARTWEEWGGEQLIKVARDRSEFLRSVLTSVIQELSMTTQKNINWILFLFTILTCSGVIISLIAVYDFDNDRFNADLRMLLILFGTLVYSCLVGAYLITTRALTVRSRKRSYEPGGTIVKRQKHGGREAPSQ